MAKKASKQQSKFAKVMREGYAGSLVPAIAGMADDIPLVDRI
jgi:hypothetical protein